MKKKGLIISTVVMVVVLIASLTTATYAWFSSSATAKVDDISMAVGASSKVQIGMRKSTATSGTNVTEYKSGTITFATNGAMDTGEYEGLGNLLTTGISLDVTAGVGSSANGTTMDAVYTKTNPLYKASGSSFDKLCTPIVARINGKPDAAPADSGAKTDVIDFKLGIRASQADVYGTYAKLTITIPQNQTYMGMITALYAEIEVGSKTYEGDIFAELAHFDTTTTEARATENKVTFYFMINEKGTEALSTTGNVTPFSIKLFISGYDIRDCVDNATGTSATISLDFDGCATDWTADTAWHQLVLNPA